jgi:hypothetical protein
LSEIVVLSDTPAERKIAEQSKPNKKGIIMTETTNEQFVASQTQAAVW